MGPGEPLTKDVTGCNRQAVGERKEEPVKLGRTQSGLRLKAARLDAKADRLRRKGDIVGSIQTGVKAGKAARKAERK